MFAPFLQKHAVKSPTLLRAVSWALGQNGAQMMSIISRLFGKKKNDYDDKPPIYGGDGLTDHSPAIINCASMGMAQALIDGFISEKCDGEWERGMEYTLSAPDGTRKPIRMICVKTSNGSEHNFYFDLSRPVSVTMKMSGL